MAKIYYDTDADISFIKDKVISIIGYGNQGRSQALNMRDSGLKSIIVGNIRDSSWHKAQDDGFEVFPVKEACKNADIMFILIPDEILPDIYKEHIEPYLKEGNVLNFASGYNITYNYIKPPEYVDVIMVAPRMIGEGVREYYKSGEGFPSFIAVEQDSSGNGKTIALAIAKAIGSTKKGVIQITFDEETHMDLLAEQATWPLVLSVLVEVFNFEVEMGHPEEAVLMELYVSKEPAIMMEKMADMGLFKQFPLHSHTSQYGQLTRYNAVDKSYIRKFIKEAYNNIKSGKFAKEWKEEQDKGTPVYKHLLDQAMNSEISKAEDRLREKLK